MYIDAPSSGSSDYVSDEADILLMVTHLGSVGERRTGTEDEQDTRQCGGPGASNGRLLMRCTALHLGHRYAVQSDTSLTGQWVNTLQCIPALTAISTVLLVHLSVLAVL